MSKSSKQTIYSLAAVAALGVVMSSPAMAGKGDNPGQGPQVSASANTMCAVVEGTKLKVVTKIINNNVGEKAGDPVVTRYSIDAWAKIGPGKWFTDGNTVPVDSFTKTWATTDTNIVHLNEGEVKSFEIDPNFDLCEVIAGLDLKGLALNATANITYAPFDGSSAEKTITNACGDDPYTLDVVEPAGIKLTADEALALQEQCKLQP